MSVSLNESCKGVIASYKYFQRSKGSADRRINRYRLVTDKCGLEMSETPKHRGMAEFLGECKKSDIPLR